jgi:hypothetical protein
LLLLHALRNFSSGSDPAPLQDSAWSGAVCE